MAARSLVHLSISTQAIRFRLTTRRSPRSFNDGESSAMRTLPSERNNSQLNARKQSKKHSRTLTTSTTITIQRKRRELRRPEKKLSNFLTAVRTLLRVEQAGTALPNLSMSVVRAPRVVRQVLEKSASGKF